MLPDHAPRDRSTRSEDASPRGRSRASVAVLLSDFRTRFGRGEPARVEEYLRRLPELAADPDAVLDLIAQELVLRQEHGEAPRPDEYRRRFPHLGEALIGLFAGHDALAAGRKPEAAGSDDEDDTATATALTDRSGSGATRPGGGRGRPGGPSWPAPEEYEIREILGRGGMGLVYKAFDRRRGCVVALKTMQGLDAGSLYRFKQEFRALQDVSHPNLVNLYELLSDGRQWFIAMELVEGEPFLRHVRGPDKPQAPLEAITGPMAAPGPTEATGAGARDRDVAVPATEAGSPPSENAARTMPGGPGRGVPPPGGSAGLSSAVERRLRAALRQLAEGVAALHAAGKLHRDIKPSNVLVDRTGRVVLLDFGLIFDNSPADHLRTGSGEEQVVGTASYMAPEQADGHLPTPAADWYSVGVMLFEALTGSRPFRGGALKVLMDKQAREAPAPGELVAGLPPDLESLCRTLLRRDPRERPTGVEVLRRLGGSGDESRAAAGGPHVPGSQPDAQLVGRAPHLRALHEAFGAVRAGRTVVLGLRGGSGVGKSALVHRFLDEVSQHADAVVLSGRCYERESVPYKALDSVVDALARYLRRRPAPEGAALLPRDVGPLIRIFPVLRRAEVVARAPVRTAEVPDPQELRRRAFAALRELLARLGDRRPLVLAIDDLQWGDADSLAALSEVLRPPDPPALLLLACYRDDGAGGPPSWAGPLPEGGGAVERRELRVDPLSAAEARDLALALLGDQAGAARLAAEAIARESGGNPLFVAELVRALPSEDHPGVTRDVDEGGGAITLDEVLWARISRLPGPARRLLEIVSVSGRPVPAALAWQALGGEGEERDLLGLLRVGRLVRGAPAAGTDAIEAYHDRVRETVLARLDPDGRRAHHRRLAFALEAADADPEALGLHFQGAGEPARAAEYHALAAARAARALAFDRAATLYRLALELRPVGDDAEAHQLRAGLADALAGAGRGAEAARAYLEAAVGGVGEAEAFELRRRAALQFLISGHIDEGLRILKDVLRAVGLSLPETPRRALVSMLRTRAWVRLRGLGFRARDPSRIAPADLARIDVCWTAGAGLSVVDWVRGADFQARGLSLALRAGEPYRIARALAMEAAHRATAGPSARRRTARLLDRADALARGVGHPYALGMVGLGRGVAAYLEGRWRAALEGCDGAEAIFRDRCTGVAWELDTAHAFALWALSHLGEVAELGRRFPRLVQEARERGDLYALMNLSTYNHSVVRLAADEPLPARDEMRDLMGRWSRDGYHVQHNDQLWGAVHIELYLGDGAAAWDLLNQHWPALARSLLLRVQFVRVSMTSLRARAALAAAAGASDPGLLRRSAARDAGRLARERAPWAVAHARLVEGLLAAARGNLDGAAGRLAAAAELYDATDMALCAAAARRRLGLLVGGDRGKALVASADASMAGQGIRSPARLAAMYAP